MCGMCWSRCLVYLDDVISFGSDVPEALTRQTEVIECLSSFGLQLKANKCTFMQTGVAFLGHIVGRAGLACDQEKLSAVWAWHAPGSVKQVHQFVGFVGYYCRFTQNFAELLEPLVALACKGSVFVWTSERHEVFETLNSCLLQAPILGLPTEADQFVLDTDASLFAVGGVLIQIQGYSKVVIAYSSLSLWQSQRWYCITPRDMLAAVMICAQFRSYQRGGGGAVHCVHRSLVPHMAFPVNVASVCGQIVWRRHRTLLLSNLDLLRK